MKKNVPAPATLKAIDLRLTKVTAGALLPGKDLNIDWTRTGYGVIGTSGYDPRDCD